MSSPELQLATAFVLNGAGRIISTREPEPSAGPLFALVRSSTACAWAVHADVSPDIARELELLARQEPPAKNLRDEPLQAEGYRARRDDSRPDSVGASFSAILF